jgi:hypothetical protein
MWLGRSFITPKGILQMTRFCKNCKYWECAIDTLGKEWSECRIDWVGRTDAIAENGIAIYAESADDTGLKTGLKTGPLFGCVRFERKEKEKAKISYIRKTRDEYILQGNYGIHGWEDLCTEESIKEIKQRLKEYRENEGGTYRVVKRRVRIETNK